jgi:hypothetical protein
MRVALVGGTGKQGRGLALRWARAGHEVRVGSRDGERGRAAAAEFGAGVAGGDNAWAVSEADVVVVCVPYAAHRATMQWLAGVLGDRVAIDVTVPLAPPKVSRVTLPEGQAAALEAQAILGADAKLVAALHHVSSVHLADVDHAIDCDVLVCSDHAGARDAAIALVEDLGVRALDAGALRNAIALESLTPVLIHMNKRYKSSGTGIRITGLPR